MRPQNLDLGSLFLHSAPGHLLWGKGSLSQNGAGDTQPRQVPPEERGDPRLIVQRHHAMSVFKNMTHRRRFPKERVTTALLCLSWTGTSELLRSFYDNVSRLFLRDWGLARPDLAVSPIVDYSLLNQIIFCLSHILFCCSLKGGEK